jgi:hypothetical protein
MKELFCFLVVINPLISTYEQKREGYRELVGKGGTLRGWKREREREREI